MGEFCGVTGIFALPGTAPVRNVGRVCAGLTLALLSLESLRLLGELACRGDSSERSCGSAVSASCTSFNFLGTAPLQIIFVMY